LHADILSREGSRKAQHGFHGSIEVSKLSPVRTHAYYPEVVRRLRLTACLLLLSAGCLPLGQPLVSVNSAAPPPPSPDLRDVRNRMDVQYRLSAPARVWTRIEATDGQRWAIHDGPLRPTPGEYVLKLDGTVPGPGRNERRVLPSGDYRVVLEADAGSGRQQVVVPLLIRDADTHLPEIEMTVDPDRITPDYDAQNDVTHISYRLARAARVAPFLDRVLADGSLERVWMGEEVRAEAGERSLDWDGTSNGQPVPSGSYVLGLRARDQAGNVVERAQPLAVERAGVPDATIVNARIGPRQMTRGSLLCLDAVVRNTGQTVLRTQGPDPGYVYNSFDTYSSIEDHRYGEHAGYWRVGLSWAGSPSTIGATYPYRWGFGHDLNPGEEVPVRGCVNVVNEQTRIVFFAGLLRENVAIYNAGAGMVSVDVAP
jgi:hypothetical protein